MGSRVLDTCQGLTCLRASWRNLVIWIQTLPMASVSPTTGTLLLEYMQLEANFPDSGTAPYRCNYSRSAGRLSAKQNTHCPSHPDYCKGADLWRSYLPPPPETPTFSQRPYLAQFLEDTHLPPHIENTHQLPTHPIEWTPPAPTHPPQQTRPAPYTSPIGDALCLHIT